VRFKSLQALRCIADPSSHQTLGASYAHKLPSMVSRLPSQVDVSELIKRVEELRIGHEESEVEALVQLSDDDYKAAVAESVPVEVGVTSAVSEYEYYYQLKMAHGADTSLLEYLGVFKMCGEDYKRGKVIQIGGTALAPGTDLPQLMQYLVRCMDEPVKQRYSIVYFHDPVLGAQFSFWTLRLWNSILPPKYFENLDALYVVQLSSMAKAGVMTTLPFINQILWKRMVYCRNLKDLHNFLDISQLCVPDQMLQEALSQSSTTNAQGNNDQADKTSHTPPQE